MTASVVRRMPEPKRNWPPCLKYGSQAFRMRSVGIRVPSDWYMKLFEKFGLNPDWIKSGTGPMFLKIDQVYTPVEGPPEGFHEEPAHYADPNAISTLTKVYSTQCAYEEGHPAPDLQTSGKIALTAVLCQCADARVSYRIGFVFPAGPPRGLCRGGYFAYAPHFRRSVRRIHAA
mgnify:CR=1 FL=1